MNILVISIIILIISFILALRSVNNELSTPPELKNLKIKKNKKITGVIIFLKEKIVHYSSESS
ncbi:hypothetical protein COV53_04705 [Candidatus Gottesmanbacteria bacterium CG11_big_fil_rev_8_21_14_0_20_37_11]|uniref:Uncharacterized protein n=3 Tax=Candidatus Gottesmaniibacteriota TaxID=1752720 RepID=A0A2M7RPN0_9BACT|nr:MAG: hypothetical protein AUJ73_05100 [Candidatus Gottesmanbacteria bacterium CG1_02_37_22]PIP33250.1 MAG: hypothetical protein COX23_00340 [Candidatus Gottesmanbacteria bacterium CG23_combo_of_CG06-09_8_20_14_all_37_19]PIR08108.1 MAG: hypothetical protein COV53_04705 [Candidatus Gottesmanbacteria bacterium CG11_big_fil_rev_8_21_14_0_20_37_11]PIZ02140.1 MAG: hypothetical protein COY59_06405 [Candidatus Gottesmanbacteria bacterium CG_4_10_14_0_8_um_filter_37_24]